MHTLQIAEATKQTFPIAILTTTNSCPESNLGLHRKKPVANRLSMMKFLIALEDLKCDSSVLQPSNCLLILLYKLMAFPCQVKSCCEIDSTGVAVEDVGESNGK